MRTKLLFVAFVAAATPLAAQPRVEVLYGFQRSVESSEAEHDGWIGASVEWSVRPGLSVGIGTDHQFESARPSTSDYQSLAIFVSVTRSFDAGPITPYVRGGLGAGRAPCEGDTCGDGIHLRGSVGARLGLTGPLEFTSEVAFSRVSRPSVGMGLSFRVGR